MNRRCVAGPKKYVLSFRVNEGEWNLLQNASKKLGQDVSTLLRQSLNSVIKKTQAD